ncbi:hypothetical protein V1478_010567 [Vespula squamosa]|uniref:Uncharacterized protein n=1 Tax=Vespula squamosa TaxID=30214 RepID=A0ABD2AI63_VESSQ
MLNITKTSYQEECLKYLLIVANELLRIKHLSDQTIQLKTTFVGTLLDFLKRRIIEESETLKSQLSTPTVKSPMVGVRTARARWSDDSSGSYSSSGGGGGSGGGSGGSGGFDAASEV